MKATQKKEIRNQAQSLFRIHWPASRVIRWMMDQFKIGQDMATEIVQSMLEGKNALRLESESKAFVEAKEAKRAKVQSEVKAVCSEHDIRTTAQLMGAIRMMIK